MDDIVTMDEAVINAVNSVISKLYKFLEIPIRLSDLSMPEEDYPYMYYNFISAYIPQNELGNHKRIVIAEPGYQKKYIHDIREEHPEMSLSFTACSANRDENGTWINGEAEAMQIATKAVGWFSHEGAEALMFDNLAVVNVSNFTSRSAILVDEYVRRWGFDVNIRYKAVTVRVDDVVEKMIICENKFKQ